MSDPYSQIHVTFDEFEIPVSLHCLCCHGVVGRRSETPSRSDPNVAVHAMLKAPNYREVYVELSDGSVSYLPFCSECIHSPIDPVKALVAVKNTWEAALVSAGRPQEAIDALRARTAALEITKVGGISNAG